ncbi:MAG TPA: class I SAM-dependent methyltransferase [Parasegetibacter sp.]
MPWFERWFNTPYYHKLYHKRDEKEAADFIDALVEYLKPAPESRMLDVACGRGRHSIQLAEKGFDVTGIDISPASIEIANQSAHEKLRFYVHDMRLPFHINYYNYAFNFFTSFGYFRTRREHDNAIRTIAQSLKSDGVFVLDYLNVGYSSPRLVPFEEIKLENTIYSINRWQTPDHFFKTITVNDPELAGPIEFTEQVAKFTLGNFEEMFLHHHLKIKEVLGDYGFNGYDPVNSPRMIMIAGKA